MLFFQNNIGKFLDRWAIFFVFSAFRLYVRARHTSKVPIKNSLHQDVGTEKFLYELGGPFFNDDCTHPVETEQMHVAEDVAHQSPVYWRDDMFGILRHETPPVCGLLLQKRIRTSWYI